MRRLLYLLAAIALVAVLVIGLTQASGGGEADDGTSFDLAAAKQELASAPAPLNGLYAQANQLLGGGKSAFDARLAQLKAHPVVVNKWASWCGPCQAEFAIFQSVAKEKGKQVAFLGIDGHDVTTRAKRFLAKRPLPFPSYTDPDDEIATARKIAVGFPMTLIIGRDGSTFIHTGQYKTRADLLRDIERYAS
jgi:cytochrome c biogenesis protein CcmG, thiol:disulfide interchange protein DsbE